MGNFLQKSPGSTYDKTLTIQLKQRTLREITECITVLQEDYADCQCLTYDQFEDIFCPIFDDPEQFFKILQNEHDLEGTVDIYETLASIAIFSGEKFERKAAFVFKLFDFDQNGTLEKSEMVLTLQSAVRSLCKFVDIDPPSLKSLADLADTIFAVIDHDNNKRISFDEFLFWIKNSSEIQDFLLNYAHTQTYENMKKRYTAVYTVLRHYFMLASESVTAEYAQEEALFKILKNEGKTYLKEKDLEYLFKVLRESTIASSAGYLTGSEKLISKKIYDNVMRAWSAFSASDVNGDNSIVTHELHPLLWIYEDQEPSDARVLNEMQEIDKDASGFIDRYEWVSNFCGPDKNGKTIFRTSLKALFERHDVDNSGALCVTELRTLVGEAFKDYVRRAKDQEVKQHLENMIDSLTREVFAELDEGDDRQIKWLEFQNYMEISLKKYENLQKFLNMYIL